MDIEGQAEISLEQIVKYIDILQTDVDRDSVRAKAQKLSLRDKTRALCNLIRTCGKIGIEIDPSLQKEARDAVQAETQAAPANPWIQALVQSELIGALGKAGITVDESLRDEAKNAALSDALRLKDKANGIINLIHVFNESGIEIDNGLIEEAKKAALAKGIGSDQFGEEGRASVLCDLIRVFSEVGITIDRALQKKATKAALAKKFSAYEKIFAIRNLVHAFRKANIKIDNNLLSEAKNAAQTEQKLSPEYKSLMLNNLIGAFGVAGIADEGLLKKAKEAALSEKLGAREKVSALCHLIRVLSEAGMTIDGNLQNTAKDAAMSEELGREKPYAIRDLISLFDEIRLLPTEEVLAALSAYPESYVFTIEKMRQRRTISESNAGAVKEKVATFLETADQQKIMSVLSSLQESTQKIFFMNVLLAQRKDTECVKAFVKNLTQEDKLYFSEQILYLLASDMTPSPLLEAILQDKQMLQEFEPERLRDALINDLYEKAKNNSETAILKGITLLFKRKAVRALMKALEMPLFESVSKREPLCYEMDRAAQTSFVKEETTPNAPHHYYDFLDTLTNLGETAEALRHYIIRNSAAVDIKLLMRKDAPDEQEAWEKWGEMMLYG